MMADASSLPRVSIVIPTWNGAEHLAVCLPSIARQTLAPLETIVIDNGSNDGTPGFLAREYPDVRVVAWKENAGFARAVNAGVREAKGDLLALINNDIELTPEWLATMASSFNGDPTIGSSACKMLRFSDRTMIDAAGDLLSRGGSPYSRGAGEPDDGRFDAAGFVFGACAGAAMYRRTLIETIGGFDEQFISYYEDVDLAFRAQLAGFRCRYVPGAVCYHRRGATSARLPGYPIRMQERNLTALHVKNLPWGLLAEKGFVIAGSRLLRLVRAVLAGSGWPALLGFLQGLLLIPAMARKRKEVQRLRRASPNTVLSLLGKRPS